MPADGKGLLAPGEVALIFRVDPRTVANWARAGLLESARKGRGHRRFDAAQPLIAGATAAGPLLTPAEVAWMFQVDAQTVLRWDATGKVTSVRTPGGIRRYAESQFTALLAPEVAA